MHRRKILFAFLAAAVALLAAQALGIELYGRHEIEWFFTPSHFIGGMCVMLAALYAATGVNFRLSLVLGLAFVGLVGAAWEVWEVALHLAPPSIDTASDLVADLAGGYAAYWLAHRYL